MANACVATNAPGCIDMHIGMCIDICIDMHIDIRIDMCIDLCVDMCVDMWLGMPQCTWLWWPPAGCCHAPRSIWLRCVLAGSVLSIRCTSFSSANPGRMHTRTHTKAPWLFDEACMYAYRYGYTHVCTQHTPTHMTVHIFAEARAHTMMYRRRHSPATHRP